MDEPPWNARPDRRRASHPTAKRPFDERDALRRATIAAALRCLRRMALALDGAPKRCVKAACRRSGCCRGNACVATAVLATPCLATRR